MIEQKVLDNIAIIKLKTGKGNTFSLADMEEFSECLNKINSNEEILGLIITGSNRSFSIGGDINSIQNLKSDEDISEYFDKMDSLLLLLFSINIPVIAAINGHAIGLGFLIALCSDYIISSRVDKIKIGLPEIKIGMAIDSTMCEVLNFNNLTGKELSKIIFQGDLLNVNEVFDMGVIDEIVNDDVVIERAIQKIKILTNDNSKAFSVNKLVIRGESIRLMKRYSQDSKKSIYIDLLNCPVTKNKLAHN